MNSLADVLRGLVLSMFGLQAGLLAYLTARSIEDRRSHIGRAVPPPSVAVLIGVSYLTLTLSALLATLYSFQHDLKGFDVTVILALRFVGVACGLPSLLYIFRQPIVIGPLTDDEEYERVDRRRIKLLGKRRKREREAE